MGNNPFYPRSVVLDQLVPHCLCYLIILIAPLHSTTSIAYPFAQVATSVLIDSTRQIVRIHPASCPASFFLKQFPPGAVRLENPQGHTTACHVGGLPQP